MTLPTDDASYQNCTAILLSANAKSSLRSLDGHVSNSDLHSLDDILVARFFLPFFNQELLDFFMTTQKLIPIAPDSVFRIC